MLQAAVTSWTGLAAANRKSPRTDTALSKPHASPRTCCVLKSLSQLMQQSAVGAPESSSAWRLPSSSVFLLALDRCFFCCSTTRVKKSLSAAELQGTQTSDSVSCLCIHVWLLSDGSLLLHGLDLFARTKVT